jgi:hypothetical protein
MASWGIRVDFREVVERTRESRNRLNRQTIGEVAVGVFHLGTNQLCIRRAVEARRTHAIH